MKNKEYKNLGIKNYFAVSKDGIVQKGIDKKMKKFCRRLARRRLKRNKVRQDECIEEMENMYDKYKEL